MNFGERLLKLLSTSNKNQAEIARIAEVSQSAVSAWINSDVIPTADTAIKIARHFGISVEYLIEGEEKEGVPVYTQGAKVQGNNVIPFSSAHGGNVVYVPFYEDVTVSAGLGSEAEDYAPAEAVPILRSFLGQYNPKSIRMLEVSGDSMTNLHLFSGDMVFFVPVENPADGLYVIGIENKLFVKRLEFDILGHEVRIISENDRYSTQVLKGEDMNRLRVVGKIIGWITRHPY